MAKLLSTFITIAGCTLSVIYFSSCNNSGSEKTKGINDSTLSDTKVVDSLTTSKKKAIEFKFATIEANLPSPFEIVNDLHTYQAPFMKDLLNPGTNADKYIAPFKKEVNFGIYGIDLAYINFYGQNQELVNYYSAIQKIARDLNMDKVFEVYADRFKSNENNKDSVVLIMDDVFNSTDVYLKKNERFVAASHILAGALIELNYLSLNLLRDLKKTPENDKLFDKVYNENLYIYYLIKLYEEYTDKDSKDLLAALKEYRKSYDENIKSAADLTPEKIAQAIGMINKVRNNLTK